MANFTKKAILQTFEEMLEHASFNKITVSDLIAWCGISANTFYYHYHDIYDLLYVWIVMKKEQCASQTKDMDWFEKLKFVFMDFRKEKVLSITFRIPSTGSVWSGSCLGQ